MTPSTSAQAVELAYPEIVRIRSPAPIFWVGWAALFAAALGLLVIAPLRRWVPGPGGAVSFVNIAGPHPDHVLAAYLALAAAAMLGYAAVLVAASLGYRPTVGVLLTATTVLALPLLLVYPLLSADIFHYVAESRVLWWYHHNPLTTAPGPALLGFRFAWEQEPSPYGPVWALVTWPIALASRAGLVWGVLAAKAMMMAALVALVGVVHRLAERLRPGSGSWAAGAVGLNPGLLLHFVANGHNDVLILLLMAVAFLALLSDHVLPSAGCLALAADLKLFAAVVAPFWLLAVLRRYDRRRAGTAVLGGIAIAAFVTAVAYLPFWDGRATFSTLTTESQKMLRSVGELLRLRLADAGVPWNSSVGVAQVSVRIASVLLVLPFLWRATRSTISLFSGVGAALLTAALLTLTWFMPWYLTWCVPLLACARPRGVAWLLWGLALSMVMTDLAVGYAYTWFPVHRDYNRYDAVAVTVQAGPVVLWCAARLALFLRARLAERIRPRGGAEVRPAVARAVVR